MRKRPKNLLLEPDAIDRAERYGRLHGTSLSRLVSNFLRSLPLGAPAASELSPVVRRLRGVAAGRTDRKAYREHWYRKYGGRRRSAPGR